MRKASIPSIDLTNKVCSEWHPSPVAHNATDSHILQLVVYCPSPFTQCIHHTSHHPHPHSCREISTSPLLFACPTAAWSPSPPSPLPVPLRGEPPNQRGTHPTPSPSTSTRSAQTTSQEEATDVHPRQACAVPRPAATARGGPVSPMTWPAAKSLRCWTPPLSSPPPPPSPAAGPVVAAVVGLPW